MQNICAVTKGGTFLKDVLGKPLYFSAFMMFSCLVDFDQFYNPIFYFLLLSQNAFPKPFRRNFETLERSMAGAGRLRHYFFNIKASANKPFLKCIWHPTAICSYGKQHFANNFLKRSISLISKGFFNLIVGSFTL